MATNQAGQRCRATRRAHQEAAWDWRHALEPDPSRFQVRYRNAPASWLADTTSRLPVLVAANQKRWARSCSAQQAACRIP